MTSRRTVVADILVTMLADGAGAAWAADKPGPSSKQCSPGQNNMGGGLGNSGPRDEHCAPLKLVFCPGGS